MYVAGEYVRRHETFVTDDIALRILHLVSGLQPAVLAGDPAPMELVPTIELATGRQDALLEGKDLAVPEAMDLTVHLDVDRDHPRHLVGRPRLGAERTPQVHQAAALGVDRHPADT